MPFDSALPATNSPVASAELRNQFNGLKELVDGAVTLEQFNDTVTNLDTGITELAANLNSEIAGTARNPVNVSPLAMTVSDPPTQAEMQAIALKLDELIGNLMRP